MMAEHAGEQLNRRSLYLRLRREIWIVPAMALAGALAAALIYSLVWLAFSGQRQYRQTSRYYLTFGKEQNGETADYYNDYTWNDLIWSVPAISDTIESGLPDGMTMEEAEEDVRARILSDVRLLTIEVTDPDPSRVQELTDVMEEALTRFGRTAVQFESIEYLSSDEVQPVVLSDRTRNAVILGAVLGFLVSAAWLWIRELLNDGIYAPEDGVRRYGIPAAAVLPAEGTELPDFLEKERDDLLKNLAGQHSACGSSEEQNAAPETTGNPDGMNRTPDRGTGDGLAVLLGEDQDCTERAAAALGGDSGMLISTEEKDTGNADHIWIVIPYGRANGTRTEHLLDHLKAAGTPAEAFVLADADGSFLTRYYGAGARRQ